MLKYIHILRFILPIYRAGVIRYMKLSASIPRSL